MQKRLVVYFCAHYFSTYVADLPNRVDMICYYLLIFKTKNMEYIPER